MGITIWMLVLLTAGAQALPKPKKVYHGSLAVEEEGVRFTEQISVEDDIVRITVPHHRDVDASDVIMDMTQNISVRYVPAVHHCYMEPSAKVYSKPGHKILMEDVTQWPTQRGDEPALSVFHAWRPGFRILPLGVPANIHSLCRDAPLFLLKPLREDRRKRQVTSCTAKNERCSLTTKACHYFPVRDCDERVLKERFGDVIGDEEQTMIRCHNRQAHVIDKVMCCAQCCEDRATADSAHPFCEDVWPECAETEEIKYADAVRFTQEMRREQEREEQRRLEEEQKEEISGEEEMRQGATTEPWWYVNDHGIEETNMELPGHGRKIDSKDVKDNGIKETNEVLPGSKEYDYDDDMKGAKPTPA